MNLINIHSPRWVIALFLIISIFFFGGWFHTAIKNEKWLMLMVGFIFFLLFLVYCIYMIITGQPVGLIFGKIKARH